MPPRVDPTGRRAATADADDGDRAAADPASGDGRDPVVDSARVFMSFVADASRFGAAVYDRDANAIETVEVRAMRPDAPAGRPLADAPPPSPGQLLPPLLTPRPRTSSRPPRATSTTTSCS